MLPSGKYHGHGTLLKSDFGLITIHGVVGV